MNFLDLIFPKDLYCISCGRPLPVQGAGGIALCERCGGEILWVSGRCCEECGRPLSDENPGRVCRDCAAGGGHRFRKGYACAVYAGLAAGVVRDMKYRGKSWYADTLAALMAAKYLGGADPETGELPSHDFLIPVPMSEKKRARRGYDQAALLAKALARKVGVVCLKNALARVRETDIMSSLAADERRQNLSEAFEVPCGMMDILKGKRLLLVDDVYTTGSTIDACAETLLAAGAESVVFIVFATGADVRRAEGRLAVVESPGQLRAKGPT